MNFFDAIKNDFDFLGTQDDWQKLHDKIHSLQVSSSDWLDRKKIIDACKILKISDEHTKCCAESCDVLLADPAMLDFAFTCYQQTFFPEKEFANLSTWPLAKEKIAQRCPMFWAVVFLAGLDNAFEAYRRRSVPDEIIFDTLGDLENWMSIHEKKYGVLGFSEQCWMYRHFRGNLFQLGRLQFEPLTFEYEFNVYRNRSTGKTIILAGDGQRFRHDGYFDGANGLFDANAWKSHFDIYGGLIVGNPVNNGRVMNNPIELRQNDWEFVLGKDDKILFLHIPSSNYKGRFSPEVCMQSFELAEDFFQTYFPDFDYKAYCTVSWLLDIQLCKILSPESNIFLFQKLFNIFPIPQSNERQTMNMVFGVTSGDVESLPQNTALQKSMIGLMKNGCRWQMGGGVRLRD